MTMSSPYEDVSLILRELVRDPKELLLRGYDDYRRLQSMESEIRALYPKYQEELSKCDEKEHYRKRCIFDDIYGPLIGETTLLFPEKFLNEWFGLEFFIVK